LSETFEHDGGRLEIRPIRPADRDAWLELMRSMSWATRFKRGARQIDQLSAADIDRAVNPDPRSELAFVAMDRNEGTPKMAGIARATLRGPATWEFTLLVLDAWQRRGIGRRLMQALIETVEARGGQTVEGEVLSSNLNMLDFVRGLGFVVEPAADRKLVRHVVLRLASKR
jgi:acetyltransferase